jgi:ATP phosphoribosyltransferase regulatory subunit
MSARLEAARAALAACAPDAALLDPPLLVSAGQALELAGEDIRPRLLFVSGSTGGELCLRPDLTLPTAQSYLAQAPAPRAYLCAGRIYRAPGLDGWQTAERESLGLERFGDPDPAAADADVLAAALAACAAAGVRDVTVKLNDLAVFTAALDALALPEPWNGRLRAAARRPARLKALLVDPVALHPDDPARALLGLAPAEAEAAAAALVSDLPGSAAGRGRAAIIRRLVAKAAFAEAPRPPEAALACLLAFFAAKGSPTRVLAKRREAAQAAGVNLEGFFAHSAARLAAMQERIGPEVELFVDPAFQGTFWYYDGFLFSIRAKRVDRGGVVAGGGRYDGLVSFLSGGAVDAPAVGLALLPDALLAAAEAEA